jgi:hypothetical protein
MRGKTRSTRGVVRSEVDVKSWMEKEPTAAQVRPSRCPCCGAASCPTGGPVVLHGHGRRARQLRGPAVPDGAPITRCFFVRRYCCQRCGATPTVVPLETLTRRLFSVCAIALALALFGLAQLPLRLVRERVSPWGTVGTTAASTWCTVPRWTAAVREGRLFPVVRRAPGHWNHRQAAARAATTLAALAPPAMGTENLIASAFNGAALAR